METIEVEVRSFISQSRYNELLEFFNNNSELIKEDYQETFYFDCPEDLRIQKNNLFSKIWLKKGKIHDEAREEIEIKFDKDQFDQLEKLFLTLGYNVEIKWFRKRYQFDWNGIKVSLDFTKGYGYIIELEKMSSESEKDIVLKELKQKLSSLDIGLTPREEFDEKYQYYKNNWKSLV